MISVNNQQIESGLLFYGKESGPDRLIILLRLQIKSMPAG
jgi:hypothetical protein